MKNKFFSRLIYTASLLLMLVIFSSGSCSKSDKPIDNEVISDIDLYVTNSNKSMLFQKVPLKFSTKDNMSPYTIKIDPSVTYQQIDGFGAAFTGSTCYNLMKMPADKRSELLKETFDPVNGMGFSYIRISIGCSDFSLSEYTYCDTPGIENFAIQEEEKKYIFPILKEILAINPKVRIMASPWTAPRWMKVNNLNDLQPYNSWTSGQLNPAYYQDYATYFVKYIKAMEQEGFKIESITIQNEPLNRGNSASMFMTWQEQRDFIKTALGPKFKENNINTKIIIYDHNYNYDSEKPDTKDQGQYPLKIYEDPEAAQYIDGAAYHAYGGDKSEMLRIHEGRPDKNLYFTEISIGLWGSGYNFGEDLMWNLQEVGIGTLNNWSKAVIVWNFMLDDKHGPDRPGGCNECLGAIDINSSNYTSYTKNSHFYDIAHLSKVIKPGSYRIKSSDLNINGLNYVATKNPDQSYGLVALNNKSTEQSITIDDGVHTFNYKIPPKSVSSFKWK
ncbi:MAG: glycoside hydrolase family 30 beta sandwich domain-containing protein [Dysgonamonadaceae bacterium]|nr:glycoside hydrolase family 30 beta sandwich domain-containing protein [Dysgonamonadaceae bacterium]MDD3309640.1 glycoside hydrolase family 30 beta sandwich domain-containing protein [Dysgonamonadaceae bacterium]MDD3900857.1 glycoside hydrolase family 30 beta sandwich domain-containing protein [Dysgonamonadaceae bacterium]MDD4398053.1 glycoside hydrolase family 30 beta sandwich domain-containing protein [Dysgonamonadaceae bacterium]